MELFAAALLGIVQGLTEFLPISSSAHLILVPWLLGWKPEGLAFDVSLHLGTALAILAYFWRDWVTLVRGALRGIAEGRPVATQERKLFWMLLVGTVPAAVIGILFEKQVEETLRSPLVTAVSLAAVAVVLFLAERRGRRRRRLEDLSWRDAIWIGLSQAVALVPGVSRSGITISTAMLRDAHRLAAARFSFLLATPVIVGAGMLEGLRLIKALYAPAPAVASAMTNAPHISWGVLAVGVSCAGLTGFLCIRYFLRYLQTRTFIPFVIYRLILAAIVLLVYFRAAAL
jgi:undecaprenyl-diphosphatase